MRGDSASVREAGMIAYLLRVSLVASGEPLRQVCRDAHMPDERRVREWRQTNREGFSPRYARARAMQLESWADEMIDIADDGSNDWETRTREDGSKYDVVNHEVINRAKLRIDTRRWLMARLRPDLYGEMVLVDVPEDGPTAKALAVTSARIRALTKGGGQPAGSSRR
jgi:hypothetical protein